MHKRIVSALELVVLTIGTNLPHRVPSQADPEDDHSLQSPRIPLLKSGLMISLFLKIGARVFHSLSASLPDLLFRNSSELGTLAEALLEYSWPQLSVFDFDDGAIPPSNFYRNVNPVDIVNISTLWVSSTVLIRLHK